MSEYSKSILKYIIIFSVFITLVNAYKSHARQDYALSEKLIPCESEATAAEEIFSNDPMLENALTIANMHTQ